MKYSPTRRINTLPIIAAALLIAAAGFNQGCGRVGRGTPYDGPSLVQHVNAEVFSEIVDNTAMPVVVNFWAPWCPPCRALSPTLDKLSVEFEGRMQVVKINVDDNQALAESFQIRSIPTTLIFRDGRSVDSRLGAGREDDFRQWLAAQL